MKTEQDTIFATSSRQYVFEVKAEGKVVAVVRSDTAGHACDWVTRTKWLSRHKLTAQVRH